MNKTSSEQGNDTYSFVVDSSDAGKRLDVILVSALPSMSRSRAKTMVSEGAIRVNGRRLRKGARLLGGDRVELLRKPLKSDFVPSPNPKIPLDICFEDAFMVVVNKPSGLATHPLVETEEETLAQALLARYPEMAGVGYRKREPGILHRLDNDTSGLLIAARDAQTFEALRLLLSKKQIDKRYLALVCGKLEFQTGTESSVAEPYVIDIPLAHSPSDRKRVVACRELRDVTRLGARQAQTEIRSTQEVGMHTLVEVRAKTAFRHQIRVHLAALGHPLVGDWLYNDLELSKEPKNDVPWLGHHFLHASRIRFQHPRTKKNIDLRSELPEELQTVVRKLENVI